MRRIPRAQLLPVLLVFLQTAAAQQTDSDLRLIDRPGVYLPGEYLFHCDLYKDPPDAPMFHTGRKPSPGERGSLTTIYTGVTRLDEGGEGPFLGNCRVPLRPGRYRIGTATQTTSWNWEFNPEASSDSVERVVSRPLPTKTEESAFEIEISEERGKVPPCRSPCTHVRREVEGTRKIIQMFKDLLEDPTLKDGQDLNDRVKDSTSGESPMFTNPENCEITVVCDRACYQEDCLPPIIFDADYQHEFLHHRSCRSHANPLEYAAEMSFPDKRAAEEILHYEHKIEVLEEWMRANCR